MNRRPEVREPIFSSIVHMLDAAATAAPGQPALVFGDERYSYAEYRSCVAALMHLFEPSRVAGKRIATVLPNSAFACAAMLAAMGSGAQLVPLNPAYTTRELEFILGDAEPVLVIAGDSVADVVAAAARSTDARIIRESELAPRMREWSGRTPLPLQPTVRADTLAMLQYTGGTTGRPKGVNLTHGAIAVNVSQREGLLPSRLDVERVLCAVPLFHSYGMGMGLFLSLYARGCLVVLPRYHPEQVLGAVEAERITVFLGNPTMYVGLMAHERFGSTDWTSVHRCYSGSAPLAMEVLNRWEARVGAPIYEGYGQTEAGPILTYNPPDRARPGSVGVALPRTEIEIVDTASGTEVLGVGERGEVRARGPQIMTGYHNQPEETAQTLRQGWLHTGDIGELDADGYLYIRDRKKDLVIVGGYNVYPREIDEVLFEHPAVIDAAAVGVADAYRGEVICAFVVVDPASAVTEAELLAHCRTNLAKYKVPSSITLVDALPKTAVNKTDKQALRARSMRERSGRD